MWIQEKVTEYEHSYTAIASLHSLLHGIRALASQFVEIDQYFPHVPFSISFLAIFFFLIVRIGTKNNTKK